MQVPRILLYIDPGSGSLLLQALLAGALGAVAVWRQNIARFFARLFGPRHSDPK
jgi:hypothetical protein